MTKQVVKYVVGATVCAQPITVTHVLPDEEKTEQKPVSPAKYYSKGETPTPLTKRKTCSHAQKDARMKYQSQKTKK